MKAICSSETSVDFQRTTRRDIPEDCTLHNPLCQDLKSYSLELRYTFRTKVWRSINVDLDKRRKYTLNNMRTNATKDIFKN
jgi:hypothetical protein